MTEEIELNNDKELKFLNQQDNYSKCYVCLSNTNYLSPCKCESTVCNICFRDILINNGIKCTICKVNFDKDVIDNIKIIIPDINIRVEDNINENENENQDEDQDDNYEESRRESCVIYYKYLFFIISTPIFGIIINELNNFPQRYLFTLPNILVGLLVWSFLILVYSIIKLFLEYLNPNNYYTIMN